MTYDSDRMNNCGLAAIDRMQIPIRPIVLGLLLAFSATAVRAQSNAPKAPLPMYPAATPQSTPLDLALHPAATPQSTPFDLALHPAATPQSAPLDLALHPVAAPQSAPLDLALLSASAELQRVARWVIDSGDNVGLPYLLIDKVNAQVFAFNHAGQLQGTAPALLGMARGDRLIAPNTATMAQMPPQVRITPAGRFVSKLAIDSHGKELLVLDYAASISLHAVVKGTPAEHRAERLKSPTSQDNRISFGCINVPAAFYSTIVSPAFTNTRGIVYVLPETGPASAVFGLDHVGTVAAGAPQGPTVLGARAAQTVEAPDTKQPLLAR